MSGPPGPGSPGLARLRPGLATREAAFLLIVAAGAWAATIALARGMAGMTGTMGLGLAAFVAIWTLMMAAMMLPSVTPTASLYARTFRDNRAVRIAGLVVGYLAVWAAAGLPAYGLAWLTGRLTGMHPGAAHILAVAVFAAAGLYQLTPAEGPLPRALPLPARAAPALRLVPGQDARPAGRRAPRRVLPGLLLGPDADPDRGGRDEHCRDGRPGRPDPDREGLALGSAGQPARGDRPLALAVATIWLPWLAPGLHAAPPMMMG